MTMLLPMSADLMIMSELFFKVLVAIYSCMLIFFQVTYILVPLGNVQWMKMKISIEMGLQD